MSPEKVALIVVTGLIAVLSGVAILGTEEGKKTADPAAAGLAGALTSKTAATPPPSSPKSTRVIPQAVEEFTYNDLVSGRARTRTPPKPEADSTPQAPVEYTVKKGETLGKIARDRLGNGALVGKIVALNKGLRVESRLQPGQKILLPPSAKVAPSKETPKVQNSGPAKSPKVSKPATPAPGRTKKDRPRALTTTDASWDATVSSGGNVL